MCGLIVLLCPLALSCEVCTEERPLRVVKPSEVPPPPPLEAHEIFETKTSTWPCQACTFENDEDQGRCEICQHSRRGALAPAPRPPPPRPPWWPQPRRGLCGHQWHLCLSQPRRRRRHHWRPHRLPRLLRAGAGRRGAASQPPRCLGSPLLRLCPHLVL